MPYTDLIEQFEVEVLGLRESGLVSRLVREIVEEWEKWLHEKDSGRQIDSR